MFKKARHEGSTQIEFLQNGETQFQEAIDELPYDMLARKQHYQVID